jgi:hypothetical protein
MPEPQETFVPLKFVLGALEDRAGLSATHALLVVVPLCANDPDAYLHDGLEDPHPDFWRFPEEIEVNGSDLIARWDISLPPLRGVMICWEVVAADYPQIGDPPPEWREPPSGPAEEAPIPQPIITSPPSSEKKDGPQVRYARELMTAKYPEGEWRTMSIVTVRKGCEKAAETGKRPLPSADSFARAMGRQKPH